MTVAKSRIIGLGLLVLLALTGAGVAGGSTAAGSGSTQAAAGSQTFGYQGIGWEFVVPEDVYYVYASVRGGHGGGGFDHAADGGRAGQVDTVLPVTPREGLVVYVGEYGWHEGGWGVPGMGGDHGAAWGDSSGYSGDGGGGATLVAREDAAGTMLVVAGAGGGAGGDDSNHAWGGNGGDGGLPAEQGFPAYGEGGGINDEGRVGGCGGCRHNADGDSGEGTDFGETVGGGGGGGGGGYNGGGGGDNGIYRFEQVDNIGGSGGGGGSSWATSTALDTRYSVAAGDCNGGEHPDPECFGQVVFSWGEPPAHVNVAAGSGQSTTVTGDFTPIAAKVTDANGIPVNDLPVQFRLPAAGPSGTFPGGAKTIVIRTNPQGVATVPRLTANALGGQWTATASVVDVPVAATFILRNLPADTSTVVSSSPDPSNYGEIPAIKATVRSAAPNLAPTGPVQFTIDAAPVGLPVQLGSDGKASLPPAQIPALEPGTHQVEAAYLGDQGHSGSTGNKTQTVNVMPTAVAVSAQPSPSQSGEEVALAATVTSSASEPPITGTVTFSDGATPLGSAPVGPGGVAERVTDVLPLGQSTITAEYSGDLFHAPATGETGHAVGPEATVTRVSSSANPIVWGSGVVWSAVAHRVDQGVALAGTISLSLDGEPLCSAAVGPDGSVACDAPPDLDSGEHRITADYQPPSGSGDLPSSGSLIQVVTPARTNTAATVAPEPSPFGESVALNGAVSAEAGQPAGSVDFSLDGATAGTSPLANGTASFIQACEPGNCPLLPGSHMVEANFVPSGSNQFPSHGAFVHQVAPAETTVELRSSQNPVPANEPLILEATVTGPANLSPPPGRVRFLVDGEERGVSDPLASGRAESLPLEGLTQGEHDIAAVYSGAPGYAPSETNGSQTVGPPDHDFGTPNLHVESRRATVNRNGSLWISARCFGEPGARCRGRSVLRTTTNSRIEKPRQPGTRQLKPGVAAAIRYVNLPTGTRKKIRVDLNNIGGRAITGSHRLPVRLRFIPDPGTAQMKPRQLVLRGVKAPVMRIIRARASARRMTARVSCRGGDGKHCVGRLNLVVKRKVVAGRGFRLRHGRARNVSVAVPPGRYRPALAGIVVRSEVRVGKDVTRRGKVRLP